MVQGVSSREGTASEVSANKTEGKPGNDTGTHESQKIIDKVLPPEHHQEETSQSSEPKKSTPNPETRASHSKGDNSSSASEKASKTRDRIITSWQSASEGNSPLIREKVSEDGYNWRKYGQKLVKGNDFLRSYYRCTHPNCAAKKQLERSHGRQILDTVYFGQHDHPRPLSSHSATGAAVPINEHTENDVSGGVAKERLSDIHGQTHHQNQPADTPQGLKISVVSSVEDVKAALLQSNRMRGEGDKDDTPGSKRRKKESGNIERSPVDRPSEPRVVVHTQTIFDVVNDGYRWRKYGQKSVKGSPHPRSYYRCSSPGCLVKKHVERSSHDSKLLMTTYEGKHDHDMPPRRTVTHTPGSEIHETNNKELSSKGEGSNSVSLNKTAQSSGPETKPREQIDGNSKVKTEETSTSGLEKDSDPSLLPNSKSNEQTNGRLGLTKEDEAAGHTNTVTNREEDKTGTCRDTGVHVSHPESNFKDQEQKPNTQPVQS